jgi:hypothetical protein
VIIKILLCCTVLCIHIDNCAAGCQDERDEIFSLHIKYTVPSINFNITKY